MIGIPARSTPSRTPWNLTTGREVELDPELFWLPAHISSHKQLQFLSEKDQRLVNQLQAGRYMDLQILSKRIQLASHSNDTRTIKHLQQFLTLKEWADQQLPMRNSEVLCQLKEQILKLSSRLDPWSKNAFLLHQQYAAQAHYKCSLKKTQPYSELFKDLFFLSLERPGETD